MIPRPFSSESATNASRTNSGSILKVAARPPATPAMTRLLRLRSKRLPCIVTPHRFRSARRSGIITSHLTRMTCGGGGLLRGTRISGTDCTDTERHGYKICGAPCNPCRIRVVLFLGDAFEHLEGTHELCVVALEQRLDVELGRVGRRERRDVGRQGDQIVGLDAAPAHLVALRREPL